MNPNDTEELNDWGNSNSLLEEIGTSIKNETSSETDYDCIGHV